MKKLIGTDYKITDGSSFAKISLNVAAEKLFDLLSEPSHVGSADRKTQLEWIFYEAKYEHEVETKFVCFTVYDYKDAKSIFEIENWHVGAKGMSREAIFDELLKLGFDSTEIELE